jgi:tetratricopeptide (TPR) repeat protein
VIFRPIRLLVAAAGLTAALGVGAAADPNSGAYLAGRAAMQANDYQATVRYFDVALRDDPDNPALLEGALTAHLALGELDAAVMLATRMRTKGFASQFASLALLTEDAARGDWGDVFDGLESGRVVGPLVDGLSQGWAYVGKGQMTQALSAFDEVIETQGLRAFGLYHKALALASVGDFEGAEAILSMSPDQGMQRTRRSTIAQAQVLSQLGRQAEAVAIIDEAMSFDPDPGLAALRDKLLASEPTPFDLVNGATGGFSEIFFGVAGALQGEADLTYVLIYSRLAQILAPDNVEATLQTAALLEGMGKYDLAASVYGSVAPDDPAYQAAEIGRAATLRLSGRADEAIAVLQALAAARPDLPMVYATLGDTLRQDERMREANTAYSKALELYREDDPALWFVHYTRGITFERLGEWPAAEADFRRSLDLQPGQPQVLNYLGYSLVERREKLDEALGMIEQAVAGQPDNGAIVDSLGWVLYRLGRYDEAVLHMEHAAELEPVDPIINDHLGDVYWAVGRQTEAKFQWQRALSFGPEEAEADRIRRKLEVGLDVVLAEEGADPLHADSPDP